VYPSAYSDVCLPGFLPAGIFAFTLSQNEFLCALLFLSKLSVRTVPIGVVGSLSTDDGDDDAGAGGAHRQSD